MRDLLKPPLSPSILSSPPPPPAAPVLARNKKRKEPEDYTSNTLGQEPGPSKKGKKSKKVVVEDTRVTGSSDSEVDLQRAIEQDIQTRPKPRPLPKAFSSRRTLDDPNL